MLDLWFSRENDCSNIKHFQILMRFTLRILTAVKMSFKEILHIWLQNRVFFNIKINVMDI